MDPHIPTAEVDLAGGGTSLIEYALKETYFGRNGPSQLILQTTTLLWTGLCHAVGRKGYPRTVQRHRGNRRLGRSHAATASISSVNETLTYRISQDLRLLDPLPEFLHEVKEPRKSTDFGRTIPTSGGQWRRAKLSPYGPSSSRLPPPLLGSTSKGGCTGLKFAVELSDQLQSLRSTHADLHG